MRLLTSCAVALTLAPTLGLAQTYACQYIMTAGLKWSNGSWESVEFKSPKPFFLEVANGALSRSSVAKALNYSDTQDIICHAPFSPDRKPFYQACVSFTGQSLIFNFQSENGGTSRILGSAEKAIKGYKDDIGVSPFTCQKVK